MTLEALGQILFAVGLLLLFGAGGGSTGAKSEWPFKISGSPGFVLLIIGGFAWWIGG